MLTLNNKDVGTKDRQIMFAFVGIIVIILLGILSFISIRDLIIANSSTTWPKVDGVITRSQVLSSHRSYKWDIAYSYEVDGKKYIGNTVRKGEKANPDISVAESIVREYPIGRAVKVFYSPEEPNECCLVSGVTFAGLIMALVAPLILLLFLIVAGILLVAKLKSRSSAGQYRAIGEGKNLNDEDYMEAYRRANKGSDEIPESKTQEIQELLNVEDNVTESQSGFNTSFWTEDMIRDKWTEFEKAGPEYALPIKHYCCKSPLEDDSGTLYVALYPKDEFENLVHFNIFIFYSSSIQQVLIQTGKIDHEWFVPDNATNGALMVEDWAREAMDYPNTPDIKKCFESVELPSTLNWVKKLDYDAWCFSCTKETLEVCASSDQGYLLMFIAYDL